MKRTRITTVCISVLLVTSATVFALDNESTKLTYNHDQQPAKVTVPTKEILDSDQDGISLHKDKCLQTPLNTPVSNDGCMLDDDKDGIANNRDQCPNTKIDHKVDKRGCDITVAETIAMQLKVEFDTNSDYLRPEYDAELERLSKFMSDFPEAVTIIEGHTDDRASAEYNLECTRKT